MEFIIRGKTSMGKTRSEQEMNLRKEWGETLSDESLEKLKYLERKGKEKYGFRENFISQADIEDVK